jgi:5,10-methylene-tetrahydrofolate dehydrogenase/methenyl tetrahydrofolate cyclohydrolase
VKKLAAAPHLVVVLVGSNPASLSYIKRKEAAASECGIRTRLLQLDDDCTQVKLASVVDELNADDDVDGIIVQLPLPPHLDAVAATGGVSPMKDVDGFLPANIGATFLNGHTPLHCPCTPKGCLQLIKSTGVPLRGLEACGKHAPTNRWCTRLR